MNYSKAIQELYRIFSEEKPISEKNIAALELGVNYLDIQAGVISSLDKTDGSYEVIESFGEVLLDDKVNYNNSFCRLALEQNTKLSISNTDEKGYSRYPAAKELGLSCYIGTPISFNETGGLVLCFLSKQEKERSFTDKEEEFLQRFSDLINMEFNIQSNELYNSGSSQGQYDSVAPHKTENRTELIQSKEKYESLVSTAPNPIILVSADDYHLKEVNTAASEISGYSKNNLIGSTIDRFFCESIQDEKIHRGSF